MLIQGVIIAIPKLSKLEDYTDVIRHQYLKEKYSFQQLASEYNVGMAKIRIFLIEHDIKIRNQGNKGIKKNKIKRGN